MPDLAESRRFRYTCRMPAPYPNTADSFWSNVTRSPTCWLWIGFRNGGGYGRLEFGGRKQLAHRVAWQLTNGHIPHGKCVCHHCDTPACVNPTHLFVGTQSENIWDGSRNGRLIRPMGSEHHHSTLTEDVVRAIRMEHTSGVRQCDLVRKYGVRKANVSLIVRRVAWKHVK